MKDIKTFFNEIMTNHKWFVVVSFLVFALILFFSLINDRFQTADFGVYYYASKAMLAGEQIYGTPFGASETGFYKYSPAVLFVYAPANLFGFKVATLINYSLQSIFAVLSVFISLKIIAVYFFNGSIAIKYKHLFIVFILTLTFINRDVLIGNVNVFLLLIICLALILAVHNRYYTSGFLFGLAVVFKPYLLVVALPFLLKGKFKSIVSLGLSILIISLIPFLFFGIDPGVQVYRDWVTALMDHDNYIISPFTIDSLIKKHLFANGGFSITYYLVGFIFLFYVVKFALRIFGTTKPDSQNQSKQFFLMESFTLLALVPNLVNTDLQQFIYSMPLVAYLIIHLTKERNLILISICILVFFFYTVDQPDLLGRAAAQTIHEYGIRGIANLGIIILSWVVNVGDRKKQTNLAKDSF